MIGRIYTSLFPYYDKEKRKNEYKKRPVLIISGPHNNDYTVLPVSSVSMKSNLDSDYDIEIDPVKYPKLNLTQISYVRTHKQTIVHQGALASEIANMKSEYVDLYLEVLEKLENFNKRVMNDAL